MATVVDDDPGLLLDHGPAVVPSSCPVGERREDIELSDERCGAGDPVGVLGEIFDQLMKELALSSIRDLLRLEDPALQLFELGDDVPLGVGQSLASFVDLGDAVEIRLGDLDGIAEDVGGLDLGFGDPGAL